MGHADDPESTPILRAFLRRLLDDRRSGVRTSLDDYRRAFPGHEELIESRYRSLLSATDAIDEARLQELLAEVAPGAEPETAPQLPERIGPYTIVGLLGEGGMGVVYLAEQPPPLRRKVAVKVIKLGMDTRKVLARFEGERAALALMSHSSIARVFDAGMTAEGRPYFVMEHVTGPTITSYCDEHHLTIRERILLFIRVCEAVQHAHQKGIIHRDIKAKNVLVSLDNHRPVPKVIDFGVAKSLSQPFADATVFTEPGAIIGTPEYMSPEQADPRSSDIDTRADIYSLGVLLYELLTGTLPIENLRQESLAELVRRVREEIPPRPSARLRADRFILPEVAGARGTTPRALVREVRGDLDWIVMKTLEKSRRRRYASTALLTEDLRRCLRRETVLARRTTFAYQLSRFVSRHRRVLAAAGAMVLVVAATWAASVSGSRTARNRESGKLLAQARGSQDECKSIEREIERQRAAYEEIRRRTEDWVPVWERAAEIACRQELARLERQLLQTRIEVMGRIQRARDIAVRGSPQYIAARRALENLHHDRYVEALPWNGLTLPAEYFRQQIEALGLGTFAAELEQRIRLRIATAPPGAEILCYRHELVEEHLVPLPYDPAAGRTAAGPFLRVERVWREGPPFRRGDRIVTVGGRKIATRGDLARVLETVGEDAPIEVTVLRREEAQEAGTNERTNAATSAVTFSWVPFPGRLSTARHAGGDGPGEPPLPAVLRPGRLVDCRLQLGITFEGFPLEDHPAARLGDTRGGPLEVDLPAGSYLLLVRREGYRDVRYPVASPWRPHEVTIRLLREEEIPPDFVYVPAGGIFVGGDPHVDQSLDPAWIRVGGFLMKRHEVTWGEYLEFLDDLTRRGELDENGSCRPRAVLPPQLARLRPEGKRVVLVPRWGSTPLARLRESKENGGGAAWQTGDPARRTLPVLGVSALAAAEYARWLTEHRYEGRWRFRLPTDEEWEKAARGADRRAHVWGPEPVWSFCRSLHGQYPGVASSPTRVGSYPLDESVYGIRDLAGSVSEPTTGVVGRRQDYVSYRGTSFYAETSYYLRIANRNGRKAGSAVRDGGIRIAADMPR